MTSVDSSSKGPILNPFWHWTAFASLLALLLLCVAWEWWLDPLVPGGSLWVLKALPLLFPLYGVYKANLYTLQWTSMLVLCYVLEGIVRWYADNTSLSRGLGAAECVLAMLCFVAAVAYLRPAKRWQRRQRQN